MAESDERSELGGLARSIDALFSQRPSSGTPPPLPTEATPPPLPTEAPPSPLPAETTPPPLPAEVPFGPDPFERLDAPPVEPVVAGEAEGPGPAEDPVVPEATEHEPALSFGDVEVPQDQDMVWKSPEEDGPATETSEPDVPAPPAGPSASELEEAVAAFLAGHPGAAAKVDRIAAEMRDRLALDPVADAVERLVQGADESADDPAVELARKIVNPAVASRLVQRMSHEEDEGRRAGYIDLSQRLGMVMANAFKGALTDASDARTRRACHEGLIGMEDTGRPVIEAMIEDDNRFLVQNAVAILGDVGGERAVQLVTSALADTDPRVRREALGSLAKLGGEDSGQLVLASLEDPNARVRAAAAEAAGRLGVERALRPMLAILDDEDLDDEERVPVEVQVLHGLGLLGDPGAVQAIEKRAVGSLFTKPPTEVRVAAYQALHDIGTPHARELIEKAKDDKDPVVRTTARGLASEG